nr:MAG TPA: hypothetical protein [Caudoviricetes sp.]
MLILQIRTPYPLAELFLFSALRQFMPVVGADLCLLCNGVAHLCHSTAQHRIALQVVKCIRCDFCHFFQLFQQDFFCFLFHRFLLSGMKKAPRVRCFLWYSVLLLKIPHILRSFENIFTA